MVWQPEVDDINRRREMALEMGGEDRVRDQHERGKLTIRERVDGLLDEGSFRERGVLAGNAGPPRGLRAQFPRARGAGRADRVRRRRAEAVSRRWLRRRHRRDRGAAGRGGRWRLHRPSAERHGGRACARAERQQGRPRRGHRAWAQAAADSPDRRLRRRHPLRRGHGAHVHPRAHDVARTGEADEPGAGGLGRPRRSGRAARGADGDLPLLDHGQRHVADFCCRTAGGEARARPRRQQGRPRRRADSCASLSRHIIRVRPV